mmetsp:Transcript_3834/g.9681  ORF Transcript_3834/g.9681 Transcript_3834/m.9681 type:complete len:211 (+) Transcript_3834:970-1602(+)
MPVEHRVERRRVRGDSGVNLSDDDGGALARREARAIRVNRIGSHHRLHTRTNGINPLLHQGSFAAIADQPLDRGLAGGELGAVEEVGRLVRWVAACINLRLPRNLFQRVQDLGRALRPKPCLLGGGAAHGGLHGNLALGRAAKRAGGRLGHRLEEPRQFPAELRFARGGALKEGRARGGAPEAAQPHLNRAHIEPGCAPGHLGGQACAAK